MTERVRTQARERYLERFGVRKHARDSGSEDTPVKTPKLGVDVVTFPSTSPVTPSLPDQERDQNPDNGPKSQTARPKSEQATLLPLSRFLLTKDQNKKTLRCRLTVGQPRVSKLQPVALRRPLHVQLRASPLLPAGPWTSEGGRFQRAPRKTRSRSTRRNSTARRLHQVDRVLLQPQPRCHQPP